MARLFLIAALLFAQTGQAFEMEAFAGANKTTYDDAPEANTQGISARAKLNFYENDRGIFLSAEARGYHLLAGEFILGYAWRTKGPLFFEGGGGLSYGGIIGPGVGLLAGFGYRVTQRLFFNFPIIAKAPGPLYWSPYIGYEF